MARPRAYEETTVVRAAMRVFWRKGFIATSMADLYDATGLKPGNLYATFADKETLFRRAFEAYVDEFRASLPRTETGLAAIKAWLDTQAKLATEDPERKGCLIVNTVSERSAHSPETQALAQARLGDIRDFFAMALEQAISEGQLATNFDVSTHAAALTGCVVAIMTLGRAGADGAMIRAVADTAFSALINIGEGTQTAPKTPDLGADHPN